MRLKSIKLVGFKSFVDSTVVPFPTNMTAIVGPNGCGKSNVIDAVRWVMGESSAKHLRGESMTDVIFNGSTHRQPVGQASIELLFDNNKGQLVGEHAAFAEISVKRKVTREGVSQYYLNGSKCRRRDVTDIFLGTGMGPRSYAIIEQGMISRLIESKPEELRVYLEEAAGISKYKERRRETENRMRRTQENLDRLSDIRDELGKQLSTLKRQANAAERYKELKALEREASAQLSAYQWNELEQSKSSHLALTEELEQGVERQVLQKASGQAQIESARTELEEAIEAFQGLQGQYYRSGAEIAKLEEKLKFERHRAEQAEEEKSRIADELRRSEERLNLLSEEESERALELEEIAPELEILLEEQEVKVEAVAEAESKFQEWLHSNEQLQEAYSDARRNADSEQSRVSSTEAQIQKLNARLVSLDDELKLLKNQLQELGSDPFSEELLQLEAIGEQLGSAVSVKESKLEGLEKQLAELNESISKERSELASAKASCSSLLAIQQDALDAQRSDENSFQSRAEKAGLKRLLDTLSIEDGWESAIESVLGELLYGVLGSESDQGILNIGSERERLVFFDQGRANAQVVAGTLSEKIGGSNVLNGFLNRFIYAEDFESALAFRHQLVDGQCLVSKDGFLFTDALIQGFGVSASEDGMVKRQQKIDALESEIDRLESALELSLVQRAEMESEQQSLRSDLKQLRAEFDSHIKRQTVLSSEAAGAKAKKEQLAFRCERVEAELRESKDLIEQDRELLEQARDAWQQAMERLESMSGSREDHAEQRDALRASIEQARDSQRDVQSKLHALSLAKQKTSDRLEVIRHSKLDLDRALGQMRTSLEALSEVETDSEMIAQLSGQLQDELVAHERDEKRLAEARVHQESLQTKLREFERARENSETVLVDLRSQLEKQRLTVQAISLEQDQKLKAIQADDFDLQVLLGQIAERELSEEGLAQELERIASRVQRLGPINLAAVDEYEAQSERKNYLDLQHEELSEALATLEGAIRKIDKETRARFKETYDRVNSGLQNLFPKIFGGGSATLELTDSDLLETGVSIIARPPGKNNSTIHLLSGGEKALTALALIFSIFKLNPAPFCMLDEVDAPLDDANVGRFARLVKEMSSTVQFIYISHNKVSMEMADQLMGVTMHEPGVSRLVSVDIDAAAQLAEA